MVSRRDQWHLDLDELDDGVVARRGERVPA